MHTLYAHCLAGLDSKSSLELVTALSDLAKQCGICIVMVVHQPRIEIWRAINHLVLLHKGETAYIGPQAHVEEYFERVLGVKAASAHDNPADVIIDSLDAVGELACRKWRERDAQVSVPVAIDNFVTDGKANEHVEPIADEASRPAHLNRCFTVVSTQSTARVAWGASFGRQVWLVFARSLLMVRCGPGRVAYDAFFAPFADARLFFFSIFFFFDFE